MKCAAALTSTATAPPPIVALLARVPDPRQPGKTVYPLVNILFIALAGTLAGMTGWKELALFAQRRRDWLARYLDVAAGLPDDEVLRRVLCALAPATFEQLLRDWTGQLARTLGADVHVDGKALRGALRHGGGALHLLHVWASRAGVLLGARAVDGAPGEGPALPDLLALLDLRGATVTGDANLCTKADAAAVRAGGAHYLFALKGNRGRLHTQVCAALAAPARLRARGVAVSKHVTLSDGHGRRERRTVWAVAIAALALPDAVGWTDLRTVVRVKRERYLADGTSQIDNHYYVTSHAPDARLLGRKIRRHWLVENHCHWALDVAYDEDGCKVRDASGAHHLAILRRIGLMMTRRDTTLAAGLAIRVKMAAVDPDYLSHLLTLGPGT